MNKKIIFCADGTWDNTSQPSDLSFGTDVSNVYKLFMNLEGSLSPACILYADEQKKELINDGHVLQVSKYLNGVGDARNYLVKLMGSSLEAQLISAIVRGYTFISRNYDAGDQIYLIGFSKGAYTARALADLIISQGLLARYLVSDSERAYRCGAEAWYKYRKLTIDKQYLDDLVRAVEDLPAFVSASYLKESDFVTVSKIAAVAVWETIGEFGIPQNAAGKLFPRQAFQLADSKLSFRVEAGFQAVALDEKRTDFEPALWEPAWNVTQILFPGTHCDVGGGYPVQSSDCGLPDASLEWMTQRLNEAGLIFAGNTTYTMKPDATGSAHKPWKNTVCRTAPRTFPADTLNIHPSIPERMDAGAVIHSPDESPKPYRPENLPISL